MLSYVDSLRVGLNFDKAILPTQEDVDELCTCIEEELRDLLKLTTTNVTSSVSLLLYNDVVYIGKIHLCRKRTLESISIAELKQYSTIT